MLYKKLIPWLLFVSSTQANAHQDQSLSTNIENVIQSEELVGITWATVNKDKIALGSAGFANVEHATKMLVHQKMHVGSVAKTVLAMGILHLISKQQLSLDSHVTSLLPQLTFNNPWQLTSPITVKHLLDHSAGLDDIRMWQLLTTEVTPQTPLQKAFHSNHANLLQVRTEPGTQFSYSNMGYTLLGMIIEAISGQRYETYLDHQFLKPIGMNESTFEFVSQQSDKMLAMGYHENHVEQSAVANYLRPAGQFTTTASDMAKFISFVLSDGVVNGQAFIKQHLMQKLFAPSNTDAFKAGLDIGHGLVFINRDRHGVNGQCHPGTTFGFRAYICIYPEQKKRFFLCCKHRP